MHMTGDETESSMRCVPSSRLLTAFKAGFSVASPSRLSRTTFA